MRYTFALLLLVFIMFFSSNGMLVKVAHEAMVASRKANRADGNYTCEEEMRGVLDAVRRAAESMEEEDFYEASTHPGFNIFQWAASCTPLLEFLKEGPAHIVGMNTTPWGKGCLSLLDLLKEHCSDIQRGINLQHPGSPPGTIYYSRWTSLFFAVSSPAWDPVKYNRVKWLMDNGANLEHCVQGDGREDTILNGALGAVAFALNSKRKGDEKYAGIVQGQREASFPILALVFSRVPFNIVQLSTSALKGKGATYRRFTEIAGIKDAGERREVIDFVREKSSAWGFEAEEKGLISTWMENSK